jgi:hypothetical protein
VIALNLGAEGDTVEVMRAVLDSNFWLATHVVVITIGYPPRSWQARSARWD